MKQAPKREEEEERKKERKKNVEEGKKEGRSRSRDKQIQKIKINQIPLKYVQKKKSGLKKKNLSQNC
jgi:hypothetical protein